MTGSDKSLEARQLDDFRKQVKGVRERDRIGWKNTQKLVVQGQLRQTLSQLLARIAQSELPEKPEFPAGFTETEKFDMRW